jgi:hypothetical protein
MADENNTEVTQTPATEVVETPQVESQAAPARQLSEVEQRAADQGWRPKDEWDGDPEDWRSAREFLRTGELFHKIDEQNRKLKSMEAVLNASKKHLDMVRKNEYNRALAALKAEKAQAVVDGDATALVEAEEKIERAKVEFVQEQQEAARASQIQAPADNPTVNVWVNRNPWYEKEPAMRVYANTVASALVANGMRDQREILAEVERRTKKEFSHKFENPNRAKAGSVEGGGTKGSSTKETYQLSAEETLVMNRFVKAGVMTKEEYIRDLKEAKGA